MMSPDALLGRAGPSTDVQGNPPTCTSSDTITKVPTGEVRYKLAEVTEDSRRGWRSFTARYGANPTALAEVLGLHLATIEGELPPMWRQIVDEAIALADQRSQRKD